MDTEGTEVILLTFFSQYYAMLLRSTLGDKCILKSVPRCLSSSCGICALVKREDLELSIQTCSENIDKLYLVKEKGYEEIRWKK